MSDPATSRHGAGGTPPAPLSRPATVALRAIADGAASAPAAVLRSSTTVAVATVVRLIVVILIVIAVVDIAIRRDPGAGRE